MNEKLKALKKRLTGMGDEPHFTVLTSDRIGAVHALNYYSKNHTQEESKAWSLDWLSDVDPDLGKLLAPVKDTYFLNRGFICRMIERGYHLSDAQYRDHFGFFFNLLEEKGIPLNGKGSVASTSKKPIPSNPNMVALDNLIEDAKEGKKVPKTISLNLNKKDLVEVGDFCIKNLSEMDTEREQYTVKMLQLMRPIYNNILAQVNRVLDSGKTNDLVKKTRKPRTPKKVVSVKKANISAVTVIKDDTVGVMGVQPKDIIGKKIAYVFDPKYKFIRVYSAMTDVVLEIKGKKIINFDPINSLEIKIKKVDAFFNSAGKRSFTQPRIQKAIDKFTGTRRPVPTGMLRETQVILLAE